MPKSDCTYLKGCGFLIGLLPKCQRIALGCFSLILADILWVVTSAITKKLYTEKYNGFEKPFFITYVRSCLFMVYFIKIFYWSPLKCCTQSPGDYMKVDQDIEDDSYFTDQTEPPGELSDATFVPLIYSGRSSGTESETENSMKKHVRFSKVTEVRHLSDKEANEALFARLSYQATLRTAEFAFIQSSKYNVPQVAKVAFVFSMLRFGAEYTLQSALVGSETGISTVVCSSSSIFVLLLCAMFPTSAADRFSLSKCVAVCISVCGLILVTISDVYLEHMHIPSGGILSIVSAMFYSLYSVFLRRHADQEEKIDIVLFFGFVGLYNCVLLWPLFFLLHYNTWEAFSLPDKTQWLVLLVEGLIGSVLPETLWLWGMLLTSPLIATLALGLTLPMSMVVDMSLYHLSYPRLFYAGAIPVVFAFVASVLLIQMSTRDPVLEILSSCCSSVCVSEGRSNKKLLEADSEQTESLININMSDNEIHEA